MIFLLPHYLEDKDRLEDDLEQILEGLNFSLDHYQLRLVTTVPELLEKIQILESGHDDRIIEAVKILTDGLFATEKPDTPVKARYYLNGLLMQVEGSQLRLVATDGHRLAYAASQIEAELPKTEVILPRKTVLELFKLLNNPSEPISVELLNNQVRFQCNGTTIVSKVIDGKFPDFNRVIPLDNDKIFLVSRTQLLGALERAAILANEKFRGARLFLQPGLLSVVCSNNEQEEAREELEIAYQGGELEVGFNIGYLMDVLRNIHSDDMQLAFGDANRSTLFTVPNNPNFKYIVMPMRI